MKNKRAVTVANDTGITGNELNLIAFTPNREGKII